MEDEEAFVPREGNELVEDQTVRLDDRTFRFTSFYKCRMVFSGGMPPAMSDVEIIQCTFILEGAALNTATYLGMLASAGDDGLVKHLLGIE